MPFPTNSWIVFMAMMTLMGSLQGCCSGKSRCCLSKPWKVSSLTFAFWVVDVLTSMLWPMSGTPLETVPDVCQAPVLHFERRLLAWHWVPYISSWFESGPMDGCYDTEIMAVHIYKLQTITSLPVETASPVRWCSSGLLRKPLLSVIYAMRQWRPAQKHPNSFAKER